MNETHGGNMPPDIRPDPGVLEADVLIGLLLLACFMIGGLGNTAALYYFFREKGNRVMLTIYRFMAFNDIVKCALVLPMFLSYFCGRQMMLFSGTIICTFWNVLFTGTSHLAVFLVAVMSIGRTMYLMNPNRRTNANAVMVMMTLVAIGIFLANLSPSVFWDLTSSYSERHVTCGWYTDTLDKHRGSPYSIINVLFTIIPLSLMVPIIISFSLNIYYLVEQRSIGPAQREFVRTYSSHHIELDNNVSMELDPQSFAFTQSPAGNRSATFTIIAITGAYLFFNFIHVIFFFIDASDGFIDRCLTIESFDHPDYYFTNYVYILAAPFNALANFFIFFIRMPRFRKGIEDKGQQSLAKVRT